MENPRSREEAELETATKSEHIDLLPAAKSGSVGPTPAVAENNQGRTRISQRGIWSRLFLLVVFLFLNSLFVFGSVDYLLRHRYGNGTVENVQPLQVVDEQSQVIDVAKNASPAVVSIIATAEVPKYENQYRDFFNFQIPSQVQNGTQEQQIGAGSGFIVSADGYIITNKHVVEQEDAKYTVILKDDKHLDEKIEATVVARDPNNDIAILKIDKTDLPFLKLGDSSHLSVGETTVAIGYALGEFDNTVSKGIISGLSRSISASGAQSGTESLENLIQTDAAVNPGNSGGPLLDIAGNVIGVNVAMADAQSIGFAIPISEVQPAYEEAKASGTIKKEAKAYLGVRYAEIDGTVQKENDLVYDYGVIITRGDTASDLAVVPGSPADQAGLVENDIILEVNGEKVAGKNTLSKLITKSKPGDQIKLKIFHKDAEREVTVTLGESQ